MLENFIPIEIFNNPNISHWHMDISKLSLSELISLKKVLVGTVSCAALDAVIYDKSNISANACYDLSKRERLRNKELRLKPVKYAKNRRKIK